MHGRELADYRDNKILSFLLSKAFNNAYSIQHSELISTDIDWFGKGIIEKYYLPNGVEDNFVEGNQKSVVNSINILYMSSINTKKGIDIMFDMLSVLKNKYNNIQCDIVGGFRNVTEEDFYNKIKSQGLQNIVKYHGFLQGANKSNILYKSDIFFFPTQRESFGNVVLEAMSFKLPVVVSNEGSLPEIVNDKITGFIVDKTNLNKFIESVEILIQDKNLRLKFGEEGRKTFLNNYTFNHFEDNLIMIFESVIEK